MRFTVGMLLLSVAGCKLSGGPAHYTNPAKTAAIVPAPSPGIIPAVVSAQASPLIVPPSAPIPTTNPGIALPASVPQPTFAPPPMPIVPAPIAVAPPMVTNPLQPTNPGPIYTPIPADGMNIASGLTTQDVMLIPRMVYVPYAPQTPINPARLSSLVPPGHPAAMPPMAQMDNSATERMAAAMERSTQMMEKMTLRIAQLEEIVRQQPQTPMAPVPSATPPLPTTLPAINPPLAMPKPVPPAPVPPIPPKVVVPPEPIPVPPPAVKPPEESTSLVLPKPTIAVEMPPLPVPLPMLPIHSAVDDSNWIPASATIPAPVRESVELPTQLLPPPSTIGYESSVEIEPIRLGMPAVDGPTAESKMPKFPGHFLRPFYPYAK